MTTACMTLACAILLGCTKSQPTGLRSVDPTAAASAAIVAWDKDANQQLDPAELVAAPGLRAALGAVDADRNGAITADELRNRLQALQGLPRTNTSFMVRVLYKGKPLSGATVRLIPEEYLRPNVLTASGLTNQNGACHPLIDHDGWTEQQRQSYGLECGMYRVEITHPQVKLSARYHAQTELGVDVALDTGRSGEGATFEIK